MQEPCADDCLSAPLGESLILVSDCDGDTPETRRTALPGVKLCIDRASERDARPVARGGINRRGSKDSQLRLGVILAESRHLPQ